MDKYLIDKVKEYSSLHNRSLSRLMESYLKSLINKEDEQSDHDIEISPFVQSMKTGVKLPADITDKIVENGLSSKFSDFEDSLQYYSA